MADVLIVSGSGPYRDPTGPGVADPAHRQVVRLSKVIPTVDRFEGRPILQVAWTAAPTH